MSTRATARHRASAPVKTPLTALVSAVSANASTMTRRSSVIAASSGLVVTMGLPASASPLADAPEAAPAAQEEATTEETPQAPEGDVTVTVPADASVSFARTALTVATPPPPPVVREATQERTAPRASRTTERAATSSSSSGTTVQAAPNEAAGSILAIAARYVGVPYVSGGTTPNGFDCSGYTQFVYAQVGISLPRTSGAQANAGRRVSAAEARPGDLVWTSGHVGIYAGGNLMYDAPRPGKSVSKREIWFTPTFIRVTG